MKNLILIITALLTFALPQCSGDFFYQYEKGRKLEQNPPALDTTPPDIISAEAVDSAIIKVEFSETLDEETAEDINNYRIQGINRLELISASLKLDGKTVQIELAVGSREYRMKHGMDYTLLVQRVEDLAENAIPYAITTFTGMGGVVAQFTQMPPAETKNISEDIYIGGTDVIAYQYSIDNGAWSLEFPVATPISLTGLSEGYHTLKVIAKKSDGEWQEINYPTVYGWNIDLTPPEAQLINTPENITESTGIDINVAGQDVTAYRYMIEYKVYDNDDWSLLSDYGSSAPASVPIVLSGISPQFYRISVIGMDQVENWQSESEATTYEWRVIAEHDIVAVLYDLPSRITKERSANITVSGIRIMYYSYKLDYRIDENSSWGTVTAWTPLVGINNLLQLSSLNDGQYNLLVTGTDEFAIQQDLPTQYIWTVDNIAPIAIISNEPAALTADKSIHIIVSGEGVVKYRYKIDNGLWSGLTDAAISIDITGLAEGSHELNVSGTDAVGNEQKELDVPTAYSWTIDNTPPEAVLKDSTKPPLLSNVNTADITVEGTSVTLYKYKLDNNTWTPEISVAANISLAGLSEGSHQIYVIGRDTAGNWQDITMPTTYSWVVDGTPTTAVLLNTPNNPTPVQSISITVIGSGAVSYKYWLDTDPWQGPADGIDIATQITASGLSSGSHTIKVIARDEADNWQSQSTPTEYTWKIDLNTPQAQFTNGLPSSPTKNTSEIITVGGTEIVSYRYKLDYESWSGEFQVATDPTIPLSGLADGVHTIYARGKKNPNIWQEQTNATSFTWTVDTDPPAAQLSGLPNNPSITTAISVSVGGIGVLTYKYVLDNPSPNWAALTEYNATVPIVETGLTEASHTLSVIAKDSAGNSQTDGSKTEFTWTINTSSAVAVLSNVPSDPAGTSSADITVGPSNLAGYKFRYSTDGNPPSGAWSAERPIGQHVTLDSLPDATIILKVVGKDAWGNWQDSAAATTAQWTIDTTRPTCKLSNTPANPTNSTSLNVFVGTETGSSTVASYKYQLDTGTWQDNGDPDNGYDVASPITASGLTDGYHRLYVIGKSESGMWQLLSGPTTLTWMVDHTGPSVTLTNTPPSLTSDTSATIWVNGAGAIKYKYSLDNGTPDWDSLSEYNLSSPISLGGLSVASHTIYVRGRDSLQNWGAITSYSWTITYIQSPAAFDAGYYDSDLLLRFSWTNPANTGNVRIQVAAPDEFGDADFTNHLIWDSGTTGVGAGQYYDYIVDTANGPTYFARVRHQHTNLSWSDTWGAASDGISIVGSISGKVKDTAGDDIGGATIALYYMSGTGQTPVLDYNDNPITTTTDSSGDFTVPDVVIGSNYYRITVSIDTRHAAKNTITVVAGEDTSLGIIYIVPTGASSGTISGTITDANIGNVIANAVIKVYNYNNVQQGTSKSTDSGGNFTTDSVAAGTYSLVISKAYPDKDYYSLTVDNVTVNGNITIGRESICEVLAEPQVRFIYKFNEFPSDPDIFIVGPTAVDQGGGDYRFWVRSNGKSYNEGTGTYVGGVTDPGDWYGTTSTTSLVQDGVTGYGPEAINLYRCSGVQYARGIYTFTVHRFSYTARNTSGNSAVCTLTNVTVTSGSATVSGTVPADWDMLGMSVTINGSNIITPTSNWGDALYYRYQFLVTGANIPADSYVMWYDRSGASHPFQINHNATSSGSITVDITNRIEAYGFYPGVPVTGAGIPSGTTIQSVTNTGGHDFSMVLSQQATANGPADLTFYPGWGRYSGLVRVYDSGGMVREIIFPANSLGSDMNAWKTLKMDVQGSTRAKRKLMQVNQLHQDNSQSKASMDW